MTAQTVFALALLVAALGCALFGVLAFTGLARLQRGARTLDHALDQRAASTAAHTTAAAKEPRQTADAKDVGVTGRGRARGGRLLRLADTLSRAAAGWLDTPFGAIVVAPEDRRLLDRCGFLDANARARFFAARIGCALLLPLLVLGLYSGEPRLAMWMVGALGFGFMLPKWLVRRRAKARQRSVASELPMFVDLLRLLQGVGLSLDQSLQVMINDFATVLPVLSKELALAHRQFSTGRTREQSLSRLATSYESDDLNAVMRLVVQVDKHGGAVQEPLRQFGDRLRESRRATLRERIGALTVKMTGVMVVTLLPALLIMTAGPGFIAVFHSLSALHR
ncbi:type II secretion system F family protein [Caballeronia sp. SEWSISQ10-4 2]|uniref:type II secretion system F family protein n=1 Tax=Caballeronia sp. SEWSISQ10-4 2 TaxID=2937438 RepID=UPI0026528448|nr:type II secretion system F family protein [Caballeronia sp. SEWSISQ10-4 2]MDN7178954.1 type II secretion system F family protein [Caballeronia sp. SEWSISQ10-4 2]